MPRLRRLSLGETTFQKYERLMITQFDCDTGVRETATPVTVTGCFEKRKKLPAVLRREQMIIDVGSLGGDLIGYTATSHQKKKVHVHEYEYE